MEIEVSLEVFKALTARLSYDAHTYDDVIRELLSLDSVIEPDPPSGPFAGLVDTFARPWNETGGFVSRGLWLPNGTKLRARYKGREYTAEIKDDKWRDHAGRVQSSPSAAATAITDTTVNGLRFWEGKRPADTIWRRLDALVRS